MPPYPKNIQSFEGIPLPRIGRHAVWNNGNPIGGREWTAPSSQFYPAAWQRGPAAANPAHPGAWPVVEAGEIGGRAYPEMRVEEWVTQYLHPYLILKGLTPGQVYGDDFPVSDIPGGPWEVPGPPETPVPPVTPPGPPPGDVPPEPPTVPAPPGETPPTPPGQPPAPPTPEPLPPGPLPPGVQPGQVPPLAAERTGIKRTRRRRFPSVLEQAGSLTGVAGPGFIERPRLKSVLGS